MDVHSTMQLLPTVFLKPQEIIVPIITAWVSLTVWQEKEEQWPHIVFHTD